MNNMKLLLQQAFRRHCNNNVVLFSDSFFSRIRCCCCYYLFSIWLPCVLLQLFLWIEILFELTESTICAIFIFIFLLFISNKAIEVVFHSTNQSHSSHNDILQIYTAQLHQNCIPCHVYIMMLAYIIIMECNELDSCYAYSIYTHIDKVMLM